MEQQNGQNLLRVEASNEAIIVALQQQIAVMAYRLAVLEAFIATTMQAQVPE